MRGVSRSRFLIISHFYAFTAVEAVRVRNQIGISESRSANEKNTTRIIGAGERGRRNERSFLRES